ncbi:nuclear transport factor 2 family protein [Streptomyces sp. NPDC093984]|uniref:nuclear transport factor 2 family protein n=1 Tax=Streptomyces sp. NPDC093984 TaxID=3366052 RepID=UPI00382D39C1
MVGAAAVAALLAGGSAGTAAWASQPASAAHHPAQSAAAHNAATVQRLADIEDIRQVKARYFRYLESKQWSKLAALFTAHPAIDVGAKYSSGKELAEKTAALLGDAPTAHQGFLPEIQVHGNRATAIWAMEDYVSFPDRIQLQERLPRLRRVPRRLSADPRPLVHLQHRAVPVPGGHRSQLDAVHRTEEVTATTTPSARTGPVSPQGVTA